MAVDLKVYSLVVTWTYFSVYVIAFLIVSIVCAAKIKKEYKASQATQELAPDQILMTKKTAITHWAKLLWKKKKVYLQLVPHFFDQATDFGVIFEYYRLSTDGNDHGINTWWLFIISVGVIILSRVVSSIAIYRLTHNIKYTILQIFDALMIQCIWTNYILDTDEPSNAQRYLQILEATFEVK